ncbi:MAG TPA: tetratricopeptide repeat protein [Terriglobales bacterium]|jgi:tetratricopeptide (TPR) repeat protein|nr:tetratricopeptide repeat protein [Terriglobales bacterium]
MKKLYIIPLLLVLAAGLSAPGAFAQATGSVKGVVKDADGKPMVGVTVEWFSEETGRRYTLKTNAKGEYFSLGISPAQYKLTVLKDGKQIFFLNGIHVAVDEVVQDVDLKKEAEQAAAGQGKTPEQIKQEEAARAAAAKETNTVKALNDKLNAAKTASDAGDFDTAIATLTEASQMDPTRDLIWFKLGDAYRQAALKQTDPAEKQKRFESAVGDYQKAIDLRTNSEFAKKEADNNVKIAAYYNNLAEVYSKSNKTDDAVASYAKAAELDPSHAGQYMFNTGAVLTNAGKVDAAIVAFDKVIAADPTKASAYYWKGVNMIGKATLKGDKMVAPEGTAEAFQKYLELEPTGTFAQPAKDMLASIGASIETTYGTKKKAAKK